MKQQITFDSIYSSTRFDGTFEVDEWMEKLVDRKVSSNGLTATYTTSESVSEELQQSIRRFSGVKSAEFNQE